MQATANEAISVRRVVAQVASQSGLSCDELANKIKVSVSKGDQYHTAAGLLLLEAKRRLPEFGLTWSAFLVGKCGFQTSRSYELMAIAEGRTTEAEVQAKGRERAARHAAKNKAARSSVSNGQLASADPFAEHLAAVIAAMKGATIADWAKLEKFANGLRADRDALTEKANRAEARRDAVATKSTEAIKKADEKVSSHQTTAIKWRVKFVPAKTVYTVQCHDVLTLTYGFGQPIHPDDADFVAKAERKDVPEHWALWGCCEGTHWLQSIHDTKEAARAALRANRLAPPNPPGPFTIIDGSIFASTTRH
jgi:hypothetical protein